MSKFTCGDLSIKGIEQLNTLLEVSITNECNAHPKASFRGIYEKGAVQKLNSMTQDTPVQIQLVNGGSKNIFTGYFNTIRLIEEGVDYDTIEVELMTRTCFLDHDVMSRSFQDVSMTYADLMTNIVQETKGISITCNVGTSETIGMPIIQYQETNWEFLLRLASHFNASIMIHEALEQAKINVGAPSGGGVSLTGERVAIGLSSKYYQLGANDSVKDRSPYRTVTVESEDDVAMGSTVTFEGMSYSVCQKNVRADGAEFIYTYELGGQSVLGVRKRINEKFVGCAIPGKVLDVQGETMKLKLDLDDDTQDASTAYYYNWTPLSGNLMYCMPEKDSQVSLYFGDGEETSGTIINCVRMNGGSCSSFSNPSDKYLTSDAGKMMKMTDTNFEFVTTNQGGNEHSLKLVNGDGIFFDSFYKYKIKGTNVSFHGKNISVQVPVQITTVQQGEESSDGACFVVNCEFDGIGLQTSILSTDTMSYAIIPDGPTQVDNSEFTKKLVKNALFGLLITAAVVAVAAVVTVATFGTGAVLVGAVVGAAAAGIASTATMTYQDAKKGVAQSTAQFASKVATDAIIGAISGAVGGGLEKAGVSAAKRLLAEEAFTLANDSINKAIDVNLGGENFDMSDFIVDETINMGITALTFGLTDSASREYLSNTKAGQAVASVTEKAKNSRVGTAVADATSNAKNAVSNSSAGRWVSEHTGNLFNSEARSAALDQMDTVNDSRILRNSASSELSASEVRYADLTSQVDDLLEQRAQAPVGGRTSYNRELREVRSERTVLGNHINAVENQMDSLNSSLSSSLFGSNSGAEALSSNEINLRNLQNNYVNMMGNSASDSVGNTSNNLRNSAIQDAAKNKVNEPDADAPLGNTSIELEYITRGARLKCDCGSHPRRLNLCTDHGYRMADDDKTVHHPFIHNEDCNCGEGENITPFGVCQGKTPPDSEEVTFKAYREDGKDTDSLVNGKKCTPVILNGWQDTKEDAFIDDGGLKTKVMTCSYLQCKYGGIITVETSGQEYKD